MSNKCLLLIYYIEIKLLFYSRLFFLPLRRIINISYLNQREYFSDKGILCEQSIRLGIFLSAVEFAVGMR